MTSDSVEMTLHKHMLSPSSLLKITGVLARNGGEKWNHNNRRVGNMSLLNMALVCIRVWVGTSHLIFSLASVGLGDPVWPLICSLPCHHDLWSLDVKYCQIHCRAADMFKRSWPLHNNNLPLITHIILIHNTLPLSRVNDVGNTMAHLWSRSLPVDFSSLSRRLI